MFRSIRLSLIYTNNTKNNNKLNVDIIQMREKFYLKVKN